MAMAVCKKVLECSSKGLRSFHVPALFPKDPTLLDKYFEDHHSPQLQSLYTTYLNKPRFTISRQDYCLGYARCPRPYKDEFHEFLKEKCIIVEDNRSDAYPSNWTIPTVSELNRPIMTLVPEPIEEGWCHGYSDFSVPKNATRGASSYFLIDFKYQTIWDSHRESTDDVKEGEGTGLKKCLERALNEGAGRIICHSDSKDVVNWVNGVEEPDSTYTKLIWDIIGLRESFADSRVKFIHRELNTVADYLAVQKAKYGRSVGYADKRLSEFTHQLKARRAAFVFQLVSSGTQSS